MAEAFSGFSVKERLLNTAEDKEILLMSMPS